jgi:hypothetical protein
MRQDAKVVAKHDGRSHRFSGSSRALSIKPTPTTTNRTTPIDASAAGIIRQSPQPAHRTGRDDRENDGHAGSGPAGLHQAPPQERLQRSGSGAAGAGDREECAADHHDRFSAEAIGSRSVLERRDCKPLHEQAFVVQLTWDGAASNATTPISAIGQAHIDPEGT